MDVRILHRDEKKGEIKLLVEDIDDLWYLYNIIEGGDLAFAMTYRRGEEASDKIRAERVEKKRMRLGISVEKCEFHPFTDILRVHGVIEEGPQDKGCYHTFNIQVGSDISIIKEWNERHLLQIENAMKTRRGNIPILAIDDEGATLAVLRNYGVQNLGRIASHVSGKMYGGNGTDVGDYYSEIIKKLQYVLDNSTEETPLLIVGPGFVKESFLRYGRERAPELFRNARLFSTSQSGMVGIQEALKNPGTASALKETRVGYETQLVEELLAEIGKNGKCAYGIKEVEEALRCGAAETLLIADTLARKKESEELFTSAERSGSRTVVISTEHDAGKRLDALGGVGALLRYKIRD